MEIGKGAVTHGFLKGNTYKITLNCPYRVIFKLPFSLESTYLITNIVIIL